MRRKLSHEKQCYKLMFILLGAISDLQTKMTATGQSLASICNVVDLVGGTASPVQDCCANSANNQIRCIERAFSGGTVSAGTNGVCQSTDSLCNVSN